MNDVNDSALSRMNETAVDVSPLVAVFAALVRALRDLVDDLVGPEPLTIDVAPRAALSGPRASEGQGSTFGLSEYSPASRGFAGALPGSLRQSLPGPVGGAVEPYAGEVNRPPVSGYLPGVGQPLPNTGLPSLPAPEQLQLPGPTAVTVPAPQVVTPKESVADALPVDEDTADLTEALKETTTAVRDLTTAVSGMGKGTPGDAKTDGKSPPASEAKAYSTAAFSQGGAKGGTAVDAGEKKAPESLIGGALSGLKAALGELPGVGAASRLMKGIGDKLAPEMPYLKAMGGAAMSAASALQSVVSASLPFVAAFSPSDVMVFNQAVRDVTAVVGSLLVPVVRQATVFIRDFGSRLLPVVEQLRPAFEAISAVLGKAAGQVLGVFSTLARVLVPVVKVAGELFGVLLGLVEPLMDVVGVVAEVVGVVGSVLSAVIKALAEGIKPIVAVLQGLGDWFKVVGVWIRTFGILLEDLVRNLLGADFSGVDATWKALRDGFSKAALASVLFAASLAKATGMTSVLDALARATAQTAKKGTEGFAAATNAQFKGFSDFGKQVALAASTASLVGGENKPATTESLLGDINKGVLDIMKGKNDFIDTFVQKLYDKFSQVATDKAYNGVSSVGKSALGFVSPGLGITSTILEKTIGNLY